MTMDRVSVSAATMDDFAACDAFVANSPNATLFHRPGWGPVVERTYGYRSQYLMAKTVAGEVQGVLPLVAVKSPLFGHALLSTAFFVYGGILAANDTVRDALARKAKELGETSGADYVELRSQSAALQEWPTKSTVYATFKREIAQDEADNLKQIPRKKRADVRKGIKSNLDVTTGIDPKTFYAIYAESLRNLGTPVFGLRFVEAILTEFGEITELSMASRDGEPLAVLMSFFFKDEVLPYYGGALPAARACHAYDLLYWSLMRRAVERGTRTFDFGRSKFGTGAFDYKAYWGFEPTPLHYQYHLIKTKEMPDINPLNPKFQLMTRIWQKLPLPVANTIGPLIARQLG